MKKIILLLVGALLIDISYEAACVSNCMGCDNSTGNCHS